MNLKDVDLKDFFRLIHEISGLNIVLDPSVKGTVTLVLDDVPWDQALDIVLKNNALDRELQGNVLRIAATDTLRKEAVDRRAQSEAVALAVDRQTITRFLSYAKAKEVVPTIKKFLTARGDVISDERTNALIISDIPSVLPNLDRLISQLDRKSQEVEIEVRVVSATRSFTRDLGFQLGFNWGNGVSTIGGSNHSNASTSTSQHRVTTTTNYESRHHTSFHEPSRQPARPPASRSATSPSRYGIDAILTAAENSQPGQGSLPSPGRDPEQREGRGEAGREDSCLHRRALPTPMPVSPTSMRFCASRSLRRSPRTTPSF